MVFALTDPAPFSEMVTRVALLKVLPVNVTGVVPQVFPLSEDRTIAGALTHPQDTVKGVITEVQPELFRAVRVWLPLATSVKKVTV